MRWNLISVAVALVLIVAGFYVSDPETTNVAQKAIYWFCVFGFLMAQGFHFFTWVRKHDQ